MSDVSLALSWALGQNFQSVSARHAKTLAQEVERLRGLLLAAIEGLEFKEPDFWLNTEPHVLRLTCEAVARQAKRATDQPEVSLSPAQLDAANLSLANESARLQEALRFYADKQHIQLSEPSKWDAPDDEASNWLCDDAGTATIEDGWMAREALKPFEVTADPTEVK